MSRTYRGNSRKSSRGSKGLFGKGLAMRKSGLKSGKKLKSLASSHGLLGSSKILGGKRSGLV